MVTELKAWEHSYNCEWLQLRVKIRIASDDKKNIKKILKKNNIMTDVCGSSRGW